MSLGTNGHRSTIILPPKCMSGCPQSTEKVLGVGILAFYQKRSEKAVPFRVQEEF